MIHAVNYQNLGCRVNRAEIDAIAQALKDAGCVTVSQDAADVVVINSCAVTGEAEAKTRKAVRRALELPQNPRVVVCGCAANLFPQELEDLSPRVTVIADKDEIAAAISGFSQDTYSQEELMRLQASADFHAPTPTGRTRPGIKIQDGCDNRCTFCIVWKARGKSTSYAPQNVRAQLVRARAAGAQEVVLTGINIGTYASTFLDDTACNLSGLLRYLLDTTDVPRLRLSSIEPPDVTPELVDTIARSQGRIAAFLHICLQSGSDATLRRMARVYTTNQYREIVAMAKKSLPGLALSCDLIVGFPGETAQEFEETFLFCKEIGFTSMHIFRYSARPGTPAATAPHQVDPRTRAERAKIMHNLANSMHKEALLRLVGTTQRVLVQAPGRAVTEGLFEVEVDKGLCVDTFVEVKIVKLSSSGILVADVPNERSQGTIK